MKDYQIIWRGPVLDATGYGTASREYILALDRLGFDVKIEGYSWGYPFKGMNKNMKRRLRQLIDKPYAANKRSVLIIHSPAGSIRPKKDRKKHDFMIINTVWETTKLPNQWVPIMNDFDAVCVPCTQNIEAMKNSGIRIPMFLVPHGSEPNKYKPDNKKFRLKEAKGKFVFLSIFDFQHRKNPEALLKAYWEEFSCEDNVILVMKTYGDRSGRQRKKINELKKKLGIGSKAAPLYLIHEIIDETKLKGLYTLGNAFVLPSRGEGVGLPYIEALSSGIPVIATGWGGQMDFLNKRNAFLVKYKLRHPGISMNNKNALAPLYRESFDEKGQLWAEADMKDLKKQMRYAYNNPAICKRKGRQGRKDMLELSWEKAGAALKQAIEKVVH
ncbi:glycosyltransferase [Paenibacillus spongiae]|uniref:Glycosyltransferase n=1 Tax=Paenibacillus spongiae TaxID=2909671 RepID=A0ABY5S3A9_9BACL|nr:glycosyltransferase [Paenibacillus spongiae]UVI28376.1 glycosyltransferase [Paenibacillus spongiae]